MATMAKRKAVPPRPARVPAQAPEHVEGLADAIDPATTSVDRPPDMEVTALAPETSTPAEAVPVPSPPSAVPVAPAPPAPPSPAGCRHTVTRTRSRAGKLWRYCEACGYEAPADQAQREILRPLEDVLGIGRAGLGKGR